MKREMEVIGKQAWDFWIILTFLGLILDAGKGGEGRQRQCSLMGKVGV